MTPLQKGRLVIDGDRTAGTRDHGIHFWCVGCVTVLQYIQG